MSNRSKITLKIAGYFSIFSAVALFVLGLFVAFNTFGVADWYMQYMRKLVAGMNNADMTFYKISTIVNLFFSILINSYSGVVYIKLAKVTHPGFQHLTLLRSLALIQLLFGGTLVSAIMALIVAARNKHLRFQGAHTTNHKQTNDISTLESKAKQLQNMRDAGHITEEQYSAKLNKLLEEYAQNNKNKQI